MIDVNIIIENIQNIFQSDIFDYFIKGVLIYLSLLWVSVIIWVTRDAINRSNSLFFQIIAIIMNIVLPVFGLILYLILRPNRTLSESYYDDLEYKLLEQNGIGICSFCGQEIEKDFLFCPGCKNEIKKKCKKCLSIYDINWDICPYCGTQSKKKSIKKK